MKYDIIDKSSNLVLAPFTDKLVRKMALEDNKTPQELKNELEEAIKNEPLHYWVRNLQNYEIMPMSKMVFTAGGGEYFDTFKEALEFVGSVSNTRDIQQTRAWFTSMNICNCECHNEGTDCMHCMPCCNFTYEKYITAEGNLNIEKYLELLKLLEGE